MYLFILLAFPQPSPSQSPRSVHFLPPPGGRCCHSPRPRDHSFAIIVMNRARVMTAIGTGVEVSDDSVGSACAVEQRVSVSHNPGVGQSLVDLRLIISWKTIRSHESCISFRSDFHERTNKLAAILFLLTDIEKGRYAVDQTGLAVVCDDASSNRE